MHKSNTLANSRGTYTFLCIKYILKKEYHQFLNLFGCVILISKLAKRSFMYLNLFGYIILVIGRLRPRATRAKALVVDHVG